MANGPTRRTLKRTQRTVNGIDNGARGESPTIIFTGDSAQGSDGQPADDDRELDGAEHATASESDTVGGVRVVEVDPANLQQFIADRERNSGDSGSGEPASERKPRKPRGPNKATRNSTPIDVAAIKMFHTTASLMLHSPSFMLDDTEAKQLADALAEFSKHHDVPMLTQKRISEINFIGALGAIYGTRLMAMLNDKKQAKKDTQRLHVMQSPVPPQPVTTQTQQPKVQ
jgi:hypothetical protein